MQRGVGWGERVGELNVLSPGRQFVGTRDGGIKKHFYKQKGVKLKTPENLLFDCVWSFPMCVLEEIVING